MWDNKRLKRKVDRREKREKVKNFGGRRRQIVYFFNSSKVPPTVQNYA
jgi:hypothetical protein